MFILLQTNLSPYRLKNVSNFYNKLSDDDSGDETELFTRNKQKHKEIEFIEKLVEEGDTLQSLSIKYRCSVGTNALSANKL